MAKKYRITCSTDPYHASRTARHRGCEILKYDMATPVKWVHEDNYGMGYTLDEARKVLMGYAREDYYNSAADKIDHKYFRLWYRDDIWLYEAEEMPVSEN